MSPISNFTKIRSVESKFTHVETDEHEANTRFSRLMRKHLNTGLRRPGLDSSSSG